MANFKTHITTSTLLGVGYAGLGAYRGLPFESALIAGGMCGVGGMLPDIDSDTGVPLRETMGFFAAVAPMFLVERFAQLGFNCEQLVLAGGAMYLFVRFGLSRLLARYTVHRGMFHSIPALMTFTGLAFLLAGPPDNLQLRYFKAGGVFLGVLSHLVLDEIYAVEWTHGRWRFKKSFGTALKLWGPSASGNLSVYAKLGLVVLLILGEPAIMDRYGQLAPVVLDNQGIRDRLRADLALDPNDPQFAPHAPQFAGNGGVPPAIRRDGLDVAPVTGPDQPPVVDQPPQRDRTIYDTARRIWHRLQE
ncbi:MAG: metal-dependent hydrolase [Planctomycetales bacterium]|nr:metal-dependent hydrolase [Planctomycetales bacterium]